MQPRTSVALDEEATKRLTRTALNMARTSSSIQKDPAYSTDVPHEVGLQLTNRCNLRCTHCFEWNDDGFNHQMSRSESTGELDLDIVRRLLAETAVARSGLFLWGGEPLFYRRWPEFAQLLEDDPRWTVLCTNGLLVEKHLDSLLKISNNLAILTSIEGFERENDVIRGRGTFKRVIRSIETVLDLQRRGEYRGKQSVHCTINDGMIGKIYDFVEYFEDLGVDTVYLCFPWYIPPDVARHMDTYVRNNFPWVGAGGGQLPMVNGPQIARHTWYSYTFHVDPDNIAALHDDLSRVNSRVWNVRVRYQPALELNELEDFILGRERPAQGRSQCLAIHNRMDVMATGLVASCKQFQEIVVGDLRRQSVSEVWKSAQFDEVRRAVSQQLMPVCSKCILLYLNGV